MPSALSPVALGVLAAVPTAAAGAAGSALGLAGMTSMAVGGYLGGHLSHSRGVGVNNAFHQHHPEDWTAALDEARLPAGAPVRAVVGDATVLLYRSNGRIHAIGSRCSHAGEYSTKARSMPPTAP